MEAPVRTAFWRLAGLFVAVFAAVLLATLLVWQHAQQQDAVIAEQRFSAEVDEFVGVLDQRIESHELVLRSASALFLASEQVSRAEWREFVAGLKLDINHPGMQGLGFAPQVEPAQLSAHNAQAQAEGLPHYVVRPVSTDPEHVYFPIYFLEPIDWRNLRAFGYDMASEQHRLAAMQRAQREGRPILTAPVVLVQETEQNTQAGALLYSPLYLPGSGLAGSDSRTLYGYVYSVFRLGDLVQGALNTHLSELNLTLTDREVPEAVLYQSAATAQPRFRTIRELPFAGRIWLLQLSSTPAFEQSLPPPRANALLISGLVAGVLLGMLLVAYARQREQSHHQQLHLTAQLKQREERFRMLLNGAPNAMLMVDQRGQIEWINPQAERLFGYAREELLQQPIEILLPVRYRDRHSGWRREFQAAPSPRQMGIGRELFALRKDGVEVPVEIGLSPIQTDDGVKTIGSVIDLSARLHAEERARMLVEAAPNAIVLVNSEGLIELVNGQTESLFGYTRSELIGQSVEMLVPESSRLKHPGLRDSYHQAPSQRQMGGNRELFARHKSGRAIPVEVGLAPIMAGGQRLIQAVVIDISTRKAAEQKLREQAEQLALANRYKSEFLANMSHELRTPLNSILILSEQLKLNNAGNLNSRQIHHAEIIHRSGSDLLNLINDILDLSKVEAGRMTLVLEAISVAETVATIETAFRPLADAKGLQLCCSIADNVPSHLRSDGQRLHQILRNLLSNAIKFTDSGRVELTVTTVVSDSVPGRIMTPEALCIAVRDTGIGIAESQLEMVFQAFRQADGSTSRRFGGTGLGLTISRQLAELLGGTLQVSSALGIGSVFSLYLPLAEVSAVIPSSSLQISGPTENAPRLLVVEDDPAFAQVLADAANQYGFTSYSTSRGVEALSLLDRLRFDAVILDLLLPDISGWQVLKELRSRPESRELPVHIISFVQQPLNWDDQAVCYLTKPVKQDALHQLLRDLPQASDSPLSVLLIEDNETEREHYRGFLTATGAQVIAVANGEEALAAYREQSFRCLIVDLPLPDMSGFDLLQAMAAERPLTHVGIIINTGMDLSHDQLQWLQQFSATVLQKNQASARSIVQAVQPFLGAVVPAPTGEDRAALPVNIGSRGRRVLLVDDDVRNIYAMSALLEQFELDVAVARDGQEAVQLLSRDPDFDLVLMDMAMPVMDGYTATRILKQDRGLSLPVIALTAHAMRGDREKCLQAGADDYLAKPIDEAAVRALLTRWLT